LCDIAERALTPSAVRDEPIIFPGRNSSNEGNTQQQTQTVSAQDDSRGDVLIRSLWERGTDPILDVRITDTDAKSYASRDPKKVLEQHEREKKRKYLAACRDQRRHFNPFVMLCTERILPVPSKPAFTTKAKGFASLRCLSSKQG